MPVMLHCLVILLISHFIYFRSKLSKEMNYTLLEVVVMCIWSNLKTASVLSGLFGMLRILNEYKVRWWWWLIMDIHILMLSKSFTDSVTMQHGLRLLKEY